LFFSGSGLAAQWSGGAPSRLVAKPVRVKIGQTTTANAALGAGTSLRGTATIGGAPVVGFVIAYDAITGDILGASGNGIGTYEIKLTGPVVVRLRVDTGTGQRQLWYRNAADFDHATPVVIPKNGTKTVDLVF
jgi:hypothetical protein